MCETRNRDVEGSQILLLEHREWASELTVMAVLQDNHASALGDHHARCRPLRRLLVPPRSGGAGGLDMPPHRPFHHTPDQQRQKSHEPSGCDTFWLLQKQTLDHHRICEQSVVLLRAVLLFVYCEPLSGTMGEVPCGR